MVKSARSQNILNIANDAPKILVSLKNIINIDEESAKEQ